VSNAWPSTAVGACGVSTVRNGQLPALAAFICLGMRIDKYTQKMQEALQASQDLASQFNDSEITNEHFLSALLDQGEGITRPLLEKIGGNVDQLRERLRSELERRPKIHGGAAELRL